MKKMFVFLTGLCLLCVSAVNVNAADDIKSKVVGKWVITVPDAPDQFQVFNAVFKLKDGAIVMDFVGGDMEVKEKEFTEKDGKLSANIYVGEYVKIVIWEENNILKGSADTSMGILPFTLKKVEEKKE